MSASSIGETITHTFTGLSVPATPTQVRLHAALADGQKALTEDPMLFRGSAVTAANAYDSSDGKLWDDDRIQIAPELLPVGTTSATNSIKSGNDCIAWAYAALAYYR